MGKIAVVIAVLVGLGIAAWDVSALTSTQINRKEAGYQARLDDINEAACSAESEEEFEEALQLFDALNDERSNWYEPHNMSTEDYFLECGGRG